uniref:Protein transport protein Sec24A n=1 Tax=Rhabditophanes sp. KR3021 TaxID=114890 RepID=A0AC35TY40_9BILA
MNNQIPSGGVPFNNNQGMGFNQATMPSPPIPNLQQMNMGNAGNVGNHQVNPHIPSNSMGMSANHLPKQHVPIQNQPMSMNLPNQPMGMNLPNQPMGMPLSNQPMSMPLPPNPINHQMNSPFPPIQPMKMALPNMHQPIGGMPLPNQQMTMPLPDNFANQAIHAPPLPNIPPQLNQMGNNFGSQPMPQLNSMPMQNIPQGFNQPNVMSGNVMAPSSMNNGMGGGMMPNSGMGYNQMNMGIPGNCMNPQMNNNANTSPLDPGRKLDLLSLNNIWETGFGNALPGAPLNVANMHAKGDSRVIRSTIGNVPETRELLKKSRLPFGVALQPFRDLTNLSIIQAHIVRCRHCRTYINPFVKFPDSRRWKCNICFRLNDLPEEFYYNPATKDRGEPSDRPEIKCATIEYIAPSEYMVRPPQPSCYLFVLDVSSNAQKSGYLQEFCEKLILNLGNLPGAKAKNALISFVCVDQYIHLFKFDEKNALPKEFTVVDIDDPFIPDFTGFVVNLEHFYEQVKKFLEVLPKLYEHNHSPSNCLGSALKVAQFLIGSVGGRVSVFQASLPDVGQGALKNRQNSESKISETELLSSANDFYKQFSLDASSAQIGIDLFALGNEYIDLATLTDLPKFSSGETYHISDADMEAFCGKDPRFEKILVRYLTRKIGWEAVLRIRCTQGLAIHTFFGNHFVRSIDLINIPCVSPDMGMGVQLELEEDLNGIDCVCIQTALLYSSATNDRRIRVHTICLPVSNNLIDIYKSFDILPAISLLTKMAAERATHNVELGDCREALINSALDAFTAYNRSVGVQRSCLLAPNTDLKFLPMFILGCLKHYAFAGSNKAVRVDRRVAALQFFTISSLEMIASEVYPVLYDINSILNLDHDIPDPGDRPLKPAPLPLSYGRIGSDEIYLMDAGSRMYLLVGVNPDLNVVNELFGVSSTNQIQDFSIFEENQGKCNQRLFNYIHKIMHKRGQYSLIIVIKQNGNSRHHFVSRLVEDKTESGHSYNEFIKHIHQTMIKNT